MDINWRQIFPRNYWIYPFGNSASTEFPKQKNETDPIGSREYGDCTTIDEDSLDKNNK